MKPVNTIILYKAMSSDESLDLDVEKEIIFAVAESISVPINKLLEYSVTKFIQPPAPILEI